MNPSLPPPLSIAVLTPYTRQVSLFQRTLSSSPPPPPPPPPASRYPASTASRARKPTWSSSSRCGATSPAKSASSRTYGGSTSRSRGRGRASWSWGTGDADDGDGGPGEHGDVEAVAWIHDGGED
ncbi:hypothetical protein DL764_000715 [Monosporascus ibericus]|uniref:Uncharacterized protein n=1 Tax=Monosporascus ibericus TaxID=155417 RepID=A0A4Q4TSM0_9PEZI|nr:hypothetical protein DL764_000715 [Monosporascus ibericus]